MIKVFRLFTLTTLFAAFVFTATAQQRQFNQNNRPNNCFDRQERMANFGNMQLNQRTMMLNQLNLTDEQSEQIDQIHLNGQKEMQTLQNQLGEKSARLRTLTTAEKYDEKAVNALIKEIGTLRTEMMTKKTAHHQQVRNVLTEEQRIQFDNRQFRQNRRGMGKHQRGSGPKTGRMYR